MIVESIRLENWKNFIEPVEIKFSDGLNILYGPNELGKSTIVESLRISLFNKHTKTKGEINDIIPWDSRLSPFSQIVFKKGNEKYRITKTFIKPKKSLLEKWDGNDFTRFAKGNEADEELVHLMGAEIPRDASKSKNWGIGQSLWMKQGDTSIKDDLNSETLFSLQNMIGAAIESEKEKKFYKKVEDEFSVYYSPTRQDRKQSPLKKLNNGIIEIQNKIEDSKDKINEKESLIKKLEDNEFMIREKEKRLEKDEKKFNELQKAIEEAHEHKNHRAKLEVEIEKYKERFNFLKRISKDIVQLNNKIEGLQTKNVELKKEQKLRNNELSKINSQFTDILDELTINKTNLKKNSEERKIASMEHATIFRETQLEENIRQLDELKSLKNEVKIKEEQISEINVPSELELKKLDDLNEKIKETKIKLDSIGLTINVTGLNELKGEISLDGEEESFLINYHQEKNWKALQSVLMMIEDVGIFEIRSKSEDVKSLRSQLENLKINFVSGLAPYDENKLENIRNLIKHKDRLEDNVQMLKAELNKKIDFDTLMQKITEDEARIKGNWTQIHDEPNYHVCEVKDKTEAINLLKKKIDEREGLKKDLEVENEEIEEKKQHLQNLKNDLEKLISKIQNQLETNEFLIEDSELKLKNLLEDGYMMNSIEDKLDEISVELEIKERTYNKFKNEIEEKETKPIEEFDINKNNIKRLNGDIQNLKLSRVRFDTQLKNIMMNTEDINKLEETLKSDEETLKEKKVYADAIELLYDLTKHYREGTVSSLTEPINQIVSDDLKKLGPNYQLDFADKMKPYSVIPNGSKTKASLNLLSFGTKEQIWFIFRLALGRLLSSEEKQLVILDDPLVNTDHVRFHHALDILKESAKDMQIILVTCDEDKYESLNVNYISVENSLNEQLNLINDF